MSLLKVDNLKMNYGEKQALKGISFSVNKGEIFSFLGPNGAGKTTTIKILTGQLQASSGMAEIDSRDVFNQANEIKRIIGIAPEKTNLYERLTVEQNLMLFCRLYQVSSTNIDRFLKEVDLEDEKDNEVRRLSKGMKQRVLIARSLLHKPQFLFLDEPTSGLDPRSANQIHKMLKSLNSQGMTIFLTSHNMEEVDKLSDRVAFIDNGKIMADGNPEELKLKYASTGIEVVVKNNGAFSKKKLSMDNEADIKRIYEFMKEKKIKTIHSCEPSLADIFNKVTGRNLK